MIELIVHELNLH